MIRLLILLALLFVSAISLVAQDNYQKVVNDTIPIGDTIAHSNGNTISFYHTLFLEKTFFRDDFDLPVNFGFSRFSSWTLFDDITFSTAQFFNTNFDSRTYFRLVDFNEWVDFRHSTFAQIVSFKGSTFASEANFVGADFGSVADFSSANFKDKVVFTYCSLPDTLYFGYVQTSKVIDLTNTVIDTIKGTDKYDLSPEIISSKRCLIDLYGTDISKLKFDYSRFRILKKIKRTFGRDTYEYPRRQLSNVYEQVLRMQQDNGFIDGYEVADKEYQEFKYTYAKVWYSDPKSFFDFSINWLQKRWWDYGYNKWLIFRGTGILLLLFTIVNWCWFRSMNEKVYMIDEVYKPEEQGLKLLDAFFYTSLIFFGIKLSIKDIRFQNYGGTIYLFVQYVCGVICLGFIVNFIIVN